MTVPASVVFWNLGQADGDYTFLEACAALESAYGTSGPREALRVELGSRRRQAGERLQTVGLDLQWFMCLVYPGARSEPVEEIGMRAFFDSFGDVELVTQCRYQAVKTLRRPKGWKAAASPSKRWQGRSVGHSSRLREKKHR